MFVVSYLRESPRGPSRDLQIMLSFSLFVGFVVSLKFLFSAEFSIVLKGFYFTDFFVRDCCFWGKKKLAVRLGELGKLRGLN